MKHISLMKCALSPSFGGCTSRFTVIDTALNGEDVTYSTAHEKFVGVYAEVISSAGVFYANVIAVGRDSTLFRDVRGIRRALTIKELLEVRTAYRFSGMIDGLAFGALGGAAWGILSTSSSSESFIGPAVIGTLSGALAGAIAGLIIGSSSVYSFPKEQR